MENYYEHVGADAQSRFSNSVSYYGRLYNLLLCNEGYHQEHHLRPQAHWTQRPTIRTELAASLDGSGRTIAALPPLLGFLESRRLRTNRPCFADARIGLADAHAPVGDVIATGNSLAANRLTA
jgi:fatty acid desaturase